jgi:hypothetical protein
VVEEVAMALPDREVAVAWLGRTVVDRDGAEIGRCVAVFTDDATGVPEWLGVRLGAVVTIVPLFDAAEVGGQVLVAVSRDQVAGAPLLSALEHISEDQEAMLYRHYGIEHSRAASATVLPAGVAPRQPAAVAARGARRLVAVSLVLAGVGAILGLVLALRRLRSR